MKNILPVFLITLCGFSATAQYQYCEYDTTITASISYSGTAATGSFGIFYSSTSLATHTINNPLLIVPGFSLFDTLTCENIDALSNGMITLLTSYGYDVILLEPDNPLDYIQRNAFLTVAMINYINTHKASNNEMVVLGLSTGAVIARYALAYMEANNMNHQALCYISYDGPQSGLNIPIGIQGWTDIMVNHGIIFGNVIALLGQHIFDQPLFEQLLYYRTPGTVYSDGIRIDSNTIKADFLNEIRNLNGCYGYPEMCKKIGVSNGALGVNQQNNNYQTLSPDTQYYFFDYSFTNGNSIYTGSLLDISGWITTDPNVPCNGNDTLAALAIEADILGAAGTAPLPCDYSYDVAPGSFSYIPQLYADEVGAYSGNYTHVQFNQFINVAGYVPIISAWDINTENPFVNLDSLASIAPLESYSPFDKVYSQPYSYDFEDYSSISNVLSNILADINSAGNYNFCTSNIITLAYDTIAIHQTDRETASQSIGAQDYIIEPGGSSYFKAGQSIVLGPGFVAEAGSNFVASIIPCDAHDCVPVPISVDRPKSPPPSLAKDFSADSSYVYAFPNPANEQVNINITGANTAWNYEIMNAMSQVCRQGIASGNQQVIDVSQMESGIYFIKVIVNNESYVQKIVVSH